MGRISLFIGLWALVCSSLSLAEDPAFVGPPKPTHLDRILEKIPSDKPFTVEQFLEVMPDELKRNYMLMTESGSRHLANKPNPRVVSFTTKADDVDQYKDPEPMVMAFSSDASDKNYHAVEFMQFHKSPPSWELKVVNFSPPNTQAPAQVSTSNPQTCVSCHKDGTPRNALVPRFAVYPHWKGAVGENIATLSADEKDFLTKFETDGANHPRFKHLDRKGNLEDATKTQAAPWRLDRVFTSAGMQIIANRLQQTPDYSKFKYAYLASAYACPKIWEMVPPELNFGGEQGFDRVLKTVTDTVIATKNKQTERALEYSKIGPRVTAGLRFLMQPRRLSFIEQGRVPSETGMPVTRTEDGVATALITNTEVGAHQLADALWQTDKDLFPYRTSFDVMQYLSFGTDKQYGDYTRFKPIADRVCGDLKTKSLEALKNFVVPPAPPVAPMVAEVPPTHTGMGEKK